ncbi:MAG: ArnT family glycosyltransferase [Candidatus Dormibacteria bacterium]
MTAEAGRKPGWYEWAGLAGLITLAAWLRLNQLREAAIYGYDEALHSIAERQLLMFHHPLALALGPPGAVPFFQTGPAYYLLLAPLYAVLRLDPFASALTIALLGIALVPLTWFFARGPYGKLGAALGAGLVTVSPILVHYSRFGWDPNPLPVATTLCLCLGLRMAGRGVRAAVLAGLAAGFASQLHATGIFLPPALALWLVWEHRPGWPRQLAAGLLAVVAAWSTWLTWNALHGFPMLRIALSVVTTRAVPNQPAAGTGGSLLEALTRAGGQLTGLGSGYGLMALLLGLGATLALAWRGDPEARSAARLVLCLEVCALATYLALRSAFYDYYLIPWYALFAPSLAALPSALRLLAGHRPRLRRLAPLPAIAILVLALGALPAAAAEPGLTLPCGYANLEAVTLAVAHDAGDRPYRLELWTDSTGDPAHEHTEGPEYILAWKGLRAPDRAQAQSPREIITMSPYPGPDPAAGERLYLAREPMATRLAEAGCYAAFRAPGLSASP